MKNSTIQIRIINVSVVDDLDQIFYCELRDKCLFTGKIIDDIDCLKKLSLIFSYIFTIYDSVRKFENYAVSSSQNCDSKCKWTFVRFDFTILALYTPADVIEVIIHHMSHSEIYYLLYSSKRQQCFILVWDKDSIEQKLKRYQFYI